MSISPVPAAVSAAVLLGITTWADGAVNYRLTEGSTFMEGCFPPCLCPIMITDDLRGTFVLEPIRITGTVDTYAVTDIDWTAFDGQITISGEGVYTIFSEFVVQHRLELDLVVGGAPPEHFDSGMILGGSIFPDIDVTVSIHGMWCYDTALIVVASPVCPDVNGDGVVDVGDLLAVLAAWGPCPGCPEDVNRDHVVNVLDMLEVLANWGACP